MLQKRKYHDEKPPQFPGSDYKPGWTTQADFILPENREGIPVYRVLRDDGDIVEGATDPEVCGLCVTCILKISPLFPAW